MKKLLHSLLALSLLVTTATFAATESDATKKDFTNVRTAALDMYKVLEGSKEGAALNESIKAEINKRQKKIQTLAAEFSKLEDELKKGASAMSKSALEERQSKLMSLGNDIQIQEKAAEKAIQEMSQDHQMTLLKKVESAIQKIAKRENIDLVIAGATLYTSARVDITQLVIDELDASFKAPAKTGTPVPTKK